MSRKSRTLSLESLSDRVVPSVSIQPMPPVPAPIAIVHPTHPLTGRGTGDIVSHHGNPDTGTTYHIHGKADLQGLGKVTVEGDIHGPGFIKSTTYTGRLHFRTGHGQVIVDLTSFRPAGPAGLPIWYRYHIVSGTGPFKKMQDSGSMRLDVHFFPTLVASPNQPGAFRMTI